MASNDKNMPQRSFFECIPVIKNDSSALSPLFSVIDHTIILKERHYHIMTHIGLLVEPCMPIKIILTTHLLIRSLREVNQQKTISVHTQKLIMELP